MKKALLLLILIALPLMAHAQVYKWKDASGKTIYSDMPPPSSVKQESIIGNKPVTPAAAPASAPAATKGAPAPAATKGAPAPAASDTNKPAVDKETAARKRQEDAEADKKKEEAKQAELEQRQKNCAAAKSNYDTYKIGGRISKINEKGERVHLGDDEIAAGLAQAKKEVEQYCDQ
jgi:hypothetical protein